MLNKKSNYYLLKNNTTCKYFLWYYSPYTIFLIRNSILPLS